MLVFAVTALCSFLLSQRCARFLLSCTALCTSVSDRCRIPPVYMVYYKYNPGTISYLPFLLNLLKLVVCLVIIFKLTETVHYKIVRIHYLIRKYEIAYMKCNGCWKTKLAGNALGDCLHHVYKACDNFSIFFFIYIISILK